MSNLNKALYDVRFFVVGFAATGLFFTSVYRAGLANGTPTLTCTQPFFFTHIHTHTHAHSHPHALAPTRTRTHTHPHTHTAPPPPPPPPQNNPARPPHPPTHTHANTHARTLAHTMVREHVTDLWVCACERQLTRARSRAT
jgi:hypothetical protein